MVQEQRIDELDPLPYTAEMPSLMSAWGRVDIHSIIAKFLQDNLITGAYVECGVASGRSAISAIRAYCRANVCKNFVLCDSFDGLPNLEGQDIESEQFFSGQFKFAQDLVEKKLEQYGVYTFNPEIDFVAGWFNESLPIFTRNNPNIKIAVLHVDVDLHKSCLDVLNNFTSMLQTGAVILFDDWNCFKASNQHGERLAASEWLKKNPAITFNHYCSYGWHGAAFIVQINKDLA